MKTKLLPTMIGAVLAGGMGAAQADITVFGHLDTSIVDFDNEVKTDIGGSVIKESEDDTNFRCTTCSIGFKGSEDLGNGLKVIFKLDFQFDMFERNKDGSITDRDQWLGLAGNFGKVRWGSISTGYKSHGAMIDPLYRTSVQGRGIGLQSGLHSGAGEEGQGRATQTARWDSPSWNGVKVTAHYTLDTDETPEDNDGYGIGAQYTNGGYLVFADYLTNDGDGKVGVQNELSAWKIGGKYTLNNFAVMAQYEDIEDDNFAGASLGFGSELGDIPLIDGLDLEQTTWHIAGSYTMGNNMIYLGYGQNDYEFSAGGSKFDLDGDTISLVGTHSLSKRTKAYAGYVTTEIDGSEGGDKIDLESDILTVGMKHKF